MHEKQYIWAPILNTWNGLVWICISLQGKLVIIHDIMMRLVMQDIRMHCSFTELIECSRFKTLKYQVLTKVQSFKTHFWQCQSPISELHWQPRCLDSPYCASTFTHQTPPYFAENGSRMFHKIFGQDLRDNLTKKNSWIMVMFQQPIT